MKYTKVLIRFGDLMLKGKNKRIFIERIIAAIKLNIKDLNITMDKRHDRVYLNINEVEEKIVEERLNRIAGIGSYSFVVECDSNLEAIRDVVIDLLNENVKPGSTLKFESKRADKNFQYTSQEISKHVAGMVLKALDGIYKVQMVNPETTVYIELREDKSYIYLDSILGMGGFPVGVAGKGLCLLSGGIDSPVASYLAMKQGIDNEGIHFESTPMTSIESAQKVLDLAKKISIFTPRHEYKVHMVPFGIIHERILKDIYEPYMITVMRRMMFRIAEKLAEKRKALVLITGESVGQVASQTLESMKTIEEVTRIPVLRPLITYDKQDIISISKKIDTYDISIQPFEDCCTVYVPKEPATRPSGKKAFYYESFMVGYEALIDEVIEKTKTFIVTPDSQLDLTAYGFTVTEAWEAVNRD